MTSLPAFAVRRWQLTLVVFVMLVALGLSSLGSIPKSEDPSFPYPNFAVVAVLPGADPADVERLVVDPLEAKLAVLDDVKSLKTEIAGGVAVLQLEFVAGSDPARKRDDVLRETGAVRPTLPDGLARLEIREFDAAKVAALQVALVSDTTPGAVLDELARRLERRLESVRGVGDVERDGSPTQEVRVALDLPKLAAAGLGAGEVLAAIGAESQAIPAGSVEGGGRRLAVRTSGDYASVDEIRGTVVRAAGAPVHLGDVADVDLVDREPTHVTRWNGRRATLVSASVKGGESIFDVRERLAAAVDGFERELPPGVELARGFDQSANVRHRLSGFARDFGLAIALVLVTLLPLGLRAAGVVMVSIPLSLSIGLFGLSALGFGINQLSIVGFVIALGLLVDDSVVVVENVVRWIRAGRTPREAAIGAARQITVSVLGCTATLVLAFLPLLALPGAAGQFIRSLPVAVVVTILASLFVSLTVVPFLASRVLVPEAEHGNRVFRALEWAIEGTFRPVLARAVARPRTTLVLSAVVVAASLALVPRIGSSLFPKAGIPQFRVTVETAEGTALARTDDAVRAVERVLLADARVKNVVANVGKGNPRVYYNVAQRAESASFGEVFAEVRTFETREQDAIFAELRASLAAIPGAKIELREFENGPPVDAPVAIRLLGDDAGKLTEAAALVERVFEDVPGTRAVKNPSRDTSLRLRTVVDRDKAAVSGLTAPDVDRAARLALGGVVAGTYRRGGGEDAVDVRVTLPRDDRATVGRGAVPSPGTLEGLVLAGPGGPVPLAQVAELVLEPAPATLRHHDRVRSVTVSALLAPGANADRTSAAVVARLAEVRLPEGVRFDVAGEAESRKESFGGLGTAVVVAVFGVLAVLVLEFRTFRGTLIVASVIPLGVAGGLVGLWLAGYTLSFTASIGFVALMGIEVKNSILLVDFTNQLREEGLGLDDAIQKAGEVRFVPILLTTLTALGGLVPLVLERSALYSPLAVVLVGGLVSSTLLARIVTPVLYKLLAPSVVDAHADAAVDDADAPALLDAHPSGALAEPEERDDLEPAWPEVEGLGALEATDAHLHRVPPRGHAHPRDGHAGGQRLPAPGVGRVERRERGLGAEREQDPGQAVAAGRRLHPFARDVARDHARDGAGDDLALELPPLAAHLGLQVHRGFVDDARAVEGARRLAPRAPARRERREVHPGHEPLGRELVRARAVARGERAGDVRERETDGDARGLLVRDAPQPRDEEHVAGGVVRRRGLGLLPAALLRARGERHEPRARERAAREEPPHRIGEPAELAGGRGLVVPAERLVDLARLLVREARQQPTERHHARVGAVHPLRQVLSHDREPTGLDARAAQVALLEVVQQVERVDEQLLVGRRLVPARGVAEDELADRVARAPREVEHVDGLVRRLVVAGAVREGAELLLDGRAVEEQERLVRHDLRREVRVPLHAELVVQRGDGALRIGRVERGAHLERARLVAGAARRGEPERERGEGERAPHVAPSGPSS